MVPKTIVLTGASDGIGAAAARTLTNDGHRVVLVGRSKAKTTAIAGELKADYYVADFADLSSVRVLAASLLERYPRIDVLANNAGAIFGKERAVTVDGHELTLQVNYLAPFLLTDLLMGRLIESKGTVINTSSVAHTRYSNFDINDLDATRGYKATRAYGNAKLAQILYTKELVRHVGSRGVSAVSFHPGNIATNFSTEASSPFRVFYGTVLKHVVLASPETGADTLVWLCEGTPNKDWTPGEYYVKRKPHKTSKLVDDTALAAKLWNRSIEMLAAAA
ncbi:SDR family NAD(P)-dependent oxidoreductase [Mycobacterium sp. AZCC_0083]|uniref:SDR family NAD(P)-dependent oxidoreductase n=1 Tax=Mycobacterium sp. AZCC_0083 TaxID=2735882 RepID=UPI0016192406|nr:SDR family NAD(P)-dependent oxidoreductase [Mycobacterium sp. AZCC_0083]MBB5165335.1 NAD(P)-dependent dehydrogenase (short-subunit alcohol dehydrogenase family) [Mycobacterium sp. AZCC_0083]